MEVYLESSIKRLKVVFFSKRSFFIGFIDILFDIME